MINQEYNKIIILCYPAGAGGNFLINCLSLTDQCVLRDAKLAEQQLSTGFSVQEKLNYFRNQLKLSLINQRWQDLNLGCSNLFGIDNEMYFFQYPEIIQKKFNYVIEQLINQEKYLFIVAHSTQFLDAYLKFWSQARVIFLTDYRDFVYQRGYGTKVDIKRLTAYWSTVRGDTWPSTPPLTYKQFLQLPDAIQHELEIDFHGEIFKWITPSPTVEELHDCAIIQQLDKLGTRAYTWSVEANFTGNEQNFITNFNKCAQWVGVTVDVSDSELNAYYRHWQDVIFKISKFNQHA